MIDLGRIVEVTYVNRVTLASATNGHIAMDEAETYHKSISGELIRLWVRFPGGQWEDIITGERASKTMADFIWRWQMIHR